MRNVQLDPLKINARPEPALTIFTPYVADCGAEWEAPHRGRPAELGPAPAKKRPAMARRSIPFCAGRARSVVVRAADASLTEAAAGVRSGEGDKPATMRGAARALAVEGGPGTDAAARTM